MLKCNILYTLRYGQKWEKANLYLREIFPQSHQLHHLKVGLVHQLHHHLIVLFMGKEQLVTPYVTRPPILELSPTPDTRMLSKYEGELNNSPSVTPLIESFSLFLP